MTSLFFLYHNCILYRRDCQVPRSNHKNPFPEYNVVYKGGIHMKIVVIKSPKLISGLLRVIFRIKKDDEC
ncbi:MAG: stage V sporulation protein SpoVM [Ruminococcus sp.]|nr:stage V sporulation protein SpoVM [Ruminococcus sp.]